MVPAKKTFANHRHKRHDCHTTKRTAQRRTFVCDDSWRFLVKDRHGETL